MVAMANVHGGPEGARAVFGAIIGAGVISIFIAPLMGRLLRFFPPVVTGTIIGISLMRVGIGWAMVARRSRRRASTCPGWLRWSTTQRLRPTQPQHLPHSMARRRP